MENGQSVPIAHSFAIGVTIKGTLNNGHFEVLRCFQWKIDMSRSEGVRPSFVVNSRQTINEVQGKEGCLVRLEFDILERFTMW
jgi:hypothetical protein